MSDRLPKILRTRGAVERGTAPSLCTCGATWPCGGPEWMGDHSPAAAPDLTPAEAAVVARFDAAPDADEALRERVARAIFHAEDAADDWSYYSVAFLNDYRRQADAAIAVIRGDS